MRKRTKAIGAPKALKLPKLERTDSSLTLSLPKPKRLAASGKSYTGVAVAAMPRHAAQAWRFKRSCSLFIKAFKSSG